MDRDQKGFASSIILGVIVVAAIILVGALVYKRDHHMTSSLNSNSSTGRSSQANPDYLIIKELGIRLKLSSLISSAYYKVKPYSNNGKPVIALYLHSLDSFSQCSSTTNGDGVAAIATYPPGYTDQVVGNYSTSYPNAPLIGGLHYFISNEQFDCSGGLDKSMPAIRRAFSAAYPTIERYSTSSTQAWSLASNSVQFITPISYSNDGVGCNKSAPEFKSTAYLDSVALLPGAKLRTIYGNGAEYFHIDICVFGNPNNLTARTWFLDESAGGIGGSAPIGNDIVSNNKINSYDTYYYKQLDTGAMNYHEMNYILEAHGKIVYVDARTYETSPSLPGIGDFTKYESAVTALANSIKIE